MDKKMKLAIEEAKKAQSIFDSLQPKNKGLQTRLDLGLPLHDISKFSPPKIPSHKEINDYQSASTLMKALSEEALRWKNSLPENYRPAILALLYGGVQIHVNNLSQVSFHGIQIEGTLNGAPCSVLAHQSTFQMLCYAEEITEETPNRPIGFIWPDHDVQV